MMTNLCKQRQSLIKIIITLMIVSLITGGLYYYSQKQTLEVPKITEKSTKKGFVLVKKGSILEKIAEEVALDKNWDILKTSGKTPQKIREEILQFTSKKSFEYMLILGSAAEIPIKDEKLLLAFLKTQGLKKLTEASLEAPLDSFYYGNIDNDPFIELSVGRLPFSLENEVRNYYKNFEIEKHIKTINIVRILGILGPIDIPSIKVQFMNYNVDNFLESESISKTTIQKYLTESDIFEYHTHGSDTWFTLGKEEENFSSRDIPDLDSNRPIILGGACYNANDLGINFLKKGAIAFLGFIHEGPNPNVFPFRPKEIGQSMGEALKESINEDIVNYKVIDFFTPSYVLYGDPSISIDYQQKNIAEKAHLIQTKKGIELAIPEYKQLNFSTGDEKHIYFFIDHYSFSILKNVYETLKTKGYSSTEEMGWIYFNINGGEYHLVEGYSSCSQLYIFKINKDYKIKKVYGEINENVIELSKYTTYGIIEGNKEKYLYVCESVKDWLDLLISDGYLNDRKIVIEISD